MRPKKIVVFWILGTLVLVAFLFGFFENAEVGLYDALFRLRGPIKPGSDIAIVAIDDRSVEALGVPPWPRSVHAELLENLKMASVIGFDIIFDASTDQDARFALSAAGNRVVLASMFTFEQTGEGYWLQQLIPPAAELAIQAKGSGFINIPADRGNIVRSVTVIDTETFGRPYPCFSLAVAMAALGITPEELSIQNGYLRGGNLEIPLDHDNQVLINFWGPKNAFPVYSYLDVLSGRFDKEHWQGKIVLIGDTTALGRDYYDNPFTRSNLILDGALPSSGVELHASAVKTYFTDHYFKRAPLGVNLLFLLFVGLITLLLNRKSPWSGLFFSLGFILLSSVFVYLLWLNGKYWLNLVAPISMTGALYMGMTLENYMRTELERRQIRQMFNRYVSTDVVNQLLESPKLELGGIRQDVSILFSDIRGFTSFSEGKDPEAVVHRLNEFFTVMTAVIFRYGGTLDKYLGDGLMAIFGAPISYPDHAHRAVSAAAEMLCRLEELNANWAKEGESPLGLGIGINSGSVVVGNIGSPERMEYTAIGEDVNLAARLEALNKEYKTEVILSQNTLSRINQSLLPFDLQVKELGETSIRGMKKPVRIHTLEKRADDREEVRGCSGA